VFSFREEIYGKGLGEKLLGEVRERRTPFTGRRKPRQRSWLQHSSQKNEEERRVLLHNTEGRNALQSKAEREKTDRTSIRGREKKSEWPIEVEKNNPSPSPSEWGVVKSQAREGAQHQGKVGNIVCGDVPRREKKRNSRAGSTRPAYLEESAALTEEEDKENCGDRGLTKERLTRVRFPKQGEIGYKITG